MKSIKEPKKIRKTAGSNNINNSDNRIKIGKIKLSEIRKSTKP